MPHKFNTSSNPSNLGAWPLKWQIWTSFGCLPTNQVCHRTLTWPQDTPCRLPGTSHKCHRPGWADDLWPVDGRRWLRLTLWKVKLALAVLKQSMAHSRNQLLEHVHTLSTFKGCHSVHISWTNFAATCIKHACQSLRPWSCGESCRKTRPRLNQAMRRSSTWPWEFLSLL